MRFNLEGLKNTASNHIARGAERDGLGGRGGGGGKGVATGVLRYRRQSLRAWGTFDRDAELRHVIE